MLTIVPGILEMLHDWVLIDSDGAGQSARQAVTGGGRSERRPRGEPTFAKEGNLVRYLTLCLLPAPQPSQDDACLVAEGLFCYADK